MIFKTLPILKRYGPWVVSIFIALFIINAMEILSHNVRSITPLLIGCGLLFMMNLLIRAALLSQEAFIQFLYLMGASYKQVAYHFHRETLYLALLGSTIGVIFATPAILFQPCTMHHLVIILGGVFILSLLNIITSRWTILRYLIRLYERLE